MAKVIQIPKAVNQTSQTMSRLAYNFTEVSATETELNIYDDIANKKSTHWWTGEEIGTEVTPDDFKNELNSVSTPEITVRINSGGGEVYSANVIAVAIREARAKGKKIKCKIDGICASATVQIAMACNPVIIDKSAYMMIHNPMAGMFGYYNAQELEDTKGFLDSIKLGILNTYVDKTGLEEAEISKMMDETTWMDGKKAVEKGFADELMFTDENKEEEVINRISMVAMNSVHNIPKELQNRLKEKGDSNMVINSVEELRKAYPEFANQIHNEAVASVSHDEAVKEAVNNERARMKSIDEMAGKVDAEVLNKAKYETFESAEKVALDAIKNGSFVSNTVLNALQDEGNATNGVAGTVNNGMVGNKPTTTDVKNKASEIAQKHFKKK